MLKHWKYDNNNNNNNEKKRNTTTLKHIIIPHVKIVSRDWLTKVGHSIMSTGKTSTVLTGSTGSHCCFHWYFTKLGFVRYNKTNMPCQCGYPDGMSPRGRMVFPRAPIWIMTNPYISFSQFHLDLKLPPPTCSSTMIDYFAK